MPGIDFDPEILQEFLTESGELLESLENDLVELEENNTDGELINKAFRALHTIKGSASFLALTELVSIAHAAETALNAARSGDAVVDETADGPAAQGDRPGQAAHDGDRDPEPRR
jgi:chemotaxis protein histidine kinase CheA